MCEEQFILSVDVFICVIISRKVRWVGHVAYVWGGGGGGIGIRGFGGETGGKRTIAAI
jgi:hypothetical protein